MFSAQQTMRNDPVQILEDLLSGLLPGSYHPLGNSFQWKTSNKFCDSEFSDIESVQGQFFQEYEAVVAQIQKTWGQCDFRGSSETQGYPEWYWISVIEMSYWQKDERIAYVSFHHEDRELPLEITLGAVTEEAISEIHSEDW